MQDSARAIPPGFRHRLHFVGVSIGYAHCVIDSTAVNALILNGALRGDDGLTPIEQAISAALNVRGWSVERIHLRDLTIAYCQGCFDCWVKTPGVCKTKDAAGEVTRAIVRTDLLVLLSPVTVGGYSSELKKALDRSIGIVSPFFTRIEGEVHHKQRYARYPSLLAVGVVAGDDPEERQIFSTLVARNAFNFHAPAHAAGFVPRAAAPAEMRSTIADLITAVTDGKRGAA
jgi:multimeric flavodoxin WrbA